MKDSPTLRRTDNVLLVTACTGFGQTGDGGCVTKQHGPGTNLNRGQKKRIFFFTILRQKYEKKLTHLQLGRHVPQADLAVVAAGDDGAEVVHHQQAADAVCGSCAAP